MAGRVICGVKCEDGARFSDRKCAKECARHLGESYTVKPKLSNFGASLGSSTDHYVLKKGHEIPTGCSIVPGAKPEPTLLEKILRAIGLVD